MQIEIQTSGDGTVIDGTLSLSGAAADAAAVGTALDDIRHAPALTAPASSSEAVQIWDDIVLSNEGEQLIIHMANQGEYEITVGQRYRIVVGDDQYTLTARSGYSSSDIVVPYIGNGYIVNPDKNSDTGIPFVMHDYTENTKLYLLICWLPELTGKTMKFYKYTDEAVALSNMHLVANDGVISWDEMPSVPSALPNPEPLVINGQSYTGAQRVELTISGADGTGTDGVGIEKLEQVTTATSSGGVNVWRMTLTNGEQYDFNVRNGAKGDTPVKGTDYWTEDDRQSIVAAVLAALPAAEEVSY